MIRTGYIVYKIEGGALVPHDHPVFTGDVAYDLPGSAQGVPVDEASGCREFVNVNEAYAALIDYVRLDPDPVSPGQFVVLPICSIALNLPLKSKSKNKK